jgi:ferredoxin
MEQTNLMVINGNELPIEPGETILDVARRSHIDIPTLCHLKGTTPTGACRICVVEVKGARTLLPACSTPAAPNMVVRTESPEVVASRKEILRLMLSSGNHNCAVRGRDDSDWTLFQLGVEKDDGSDELCPVWGDCRLQDLAYRYQVTGEGFRGPRPAIQWKRSTRLSCGIFPVASFAAGASKPATRCRLTMPSASDTAVRPQKSSPPATGR